MLKLVARLAPLVIVAVLAWLAFGHAILPASPVVMACQIGALGLIVWARISFPQGSFAVGAAPSGATVIRHGPYRLIRHPMYAGALLFFWASALGHLTVLTFVLAAAATAVAAARIAVEEPMLRARYPDYDAYARATKMLVPFLL